jgi:purine-binding chemotaxis protein CheW
VVLTCTSIGLFLLCRADARLCAIPLEHVVETMRFQPLQPLPDVPAYVRGLSIIRGEATPVVDVARLLGAAGAQPSRLVSIRVDGRGVALAVNSVLGIAEIPEDTLKTLPPLVASANSQSLALLGSLDGELLLVLRSASIVPESVWPALMAREAA